MADPDSPSPEAHQPDRPNGLGTSDPLLSARLALYPYKSPIYQVTVTSNYISWEPLTPQKSRNKSLKGKRSSSKLSVNSDCSDARSSVVGQGGLFLHVDDISGCDCMKGRVEGDLGAYVTIYAYPLKKTFGKKSMIRKRETLTLTFNTTDSYEGNYEEAIRWRTLIQCLAKRVDVRSPEEIAELQIPAPKRLLMLINPASGKGKALHLFKHRIVPVLAEASVAYETKVTKYAGEAREFVQTLDLSQFHGLVIVSGDGLIFEVINGLMARPDWERAIKFPIGCLPGGSGNALCCSISYHAGEPYLDNNHVLYSSFGLTKHVLRPMHLVAVDTCDGSRLYSFLSSGWGLIADVDIESERYRKIGEARFLLGSLVRIFNLRKYLGKVSFLPVEEYHEQPWSTDRTSGVSRSQSSPGGDQHHGAAAGSPQRSQSMIEGSDNPKTALFRPDSVVEADEHDAHLQDLEKVTPATTAAPPVSPNPAASPSINSSRGPPVALPPLSEPVPSDWVTIEDEFLMVGAIYLSHLNKEMIPLPDIKFDADCIHLVVLRAGLSRMKLIKMMGELETGKVTQGERIQVIKVSAFRIEPDQEDGIMTVDGERIKYGPIQGQLLPSMTNIMVPKQGKFL